MSSSEEAKPVALSIALAEGISYSVSRKFFKFHNLLEGFRVDLKTFLGFGCA